MTRQRLLVSLLATSLLAVPGLAMAGRGHKKDPARAAKFAAKIAAFDTNKDGKLDRAERKAMHQKRRTQMLAKYDTNKDGQLSDAERAAKHKDRVNAKFAKFDANRDGSISQSEAANTRLGRHFDKVNADGNGAITKTEIAAMKRGRRGHKGKAGPMGKKFHRGQTPENAPR